MITQSLAPIVTRLDHLENKRDDALKEAQLIWFIWLRPDDQMDDDFTNHHIQGLP